jgi:hypothetical protein
MICDLCGKPATHWTRDYLDYPNPAPRPVPPIKRGWCPVHRPADAIPLAADEALPDDLGQRLEQRNQATLVMLFFSLGAILGTALDLFGRLLAWWE